MTNSKPYDAIFSGVIGQEYELLKLLSPLSAEMSHQVGLAVADFAKQQTENLSVIELGGGTGITTLAILSAAENVHILSIDNEPVMQNQAKQRLHHWVSEQKLTFSSQDALSALGLIETESVDIVASAYTLHNFEDNYRKQVITEIYRVLKLGGQFINGDRYALDDVNAHTRLTQEEVSGYFKTLIGLNKLDILEHWIIHLFSDESANHIMRESPALQQLQHAGFQNIQLKQRQLVNALLSADKAK